MRYYLKRCGFQELGSIRDGRPQRGRYLLTSMDALDFFPPLSTAQLNDSAILPIIPLYSGKKVYCNYVYHNDKFHGSTAAHKRNEYRIYLNKELENGSLLFQTDDIVIIRNEEISEDGETQTIFYLDLVQDKLSALYRELNAKIDTYPIKGAYGIIEEGLISEFEKKIESLHKNADTSVAIDDSVTKKIEGNSTDAVANLFNAVSFRDFVMVGYDSLCAVTGTVIRYEAYMNLEAAHIKPRSHGGLFMPSNGIALCRDMHWAFDKGFFTLSEDCRIQVHPKTTSELLRSYHGKALYVPKEPFFRPDVNNIRYHANNVYGLFMTSGRL
jgi:hypothetical protein